MAEKEKEVKVIKIMLYFDQRLLDIVDELIYKGMHGNRNEFFRDLIKKEAKAKGIIIKEEKPSKTKSKEKGELNDAN